MPSFRGAFFVGVAVVAAIGSSLCAQSPDIPSLRKQPRGRLLESRDRSGKVQRITRAQEWEQGRRQEAIQGFLAVTGPVPGPERRCDLDVRIEEEVDAGKYVRRLITYASEPGSRTTAYLCIPKEALKGSPARAVLCLHPTENSIGHKVVVGLGGKPHRQYASELAERGFVTLAPSYPQLAQYQPDLKALGYQSGTMKAVWDNKRGMDCLEALPFIDKAPGFAVIGHSLGGHNSIFTAALDERIKVIVSSCGFDSFLDYYGGNIKGWTQDRYMPRMSEYVGHPQDAPFDFYELLAVLAPRAVFINAPLRDSNFKWDSVDRIVSAARPVFGLYRASDRLRVEHPDSEHDFPDEQRFAAYDWIDRFLR